MNRIKYLGRALKHQLVVAYAQLPPGNKRPSNQKVIRSVMIIPPASPGGLGDDALMTSLLGEVKSRGADRIQIGQWASDDRWPAAPDADYFPLPGRSFRSWKTVISRLKSTDALLVVGADMLDGYYGINHSLLLFRLADLAARMGISSTIIGSSFSDAAAEGVKRFVSGMSPRVTLFARDILSFERIAAIRPSKTPLSADIAFLLKPSTSQDSDTLRQIHEWIDGARARGIKTVVGCNVNSLPLAKSNHSLDQLVDAHVAGFVEAAKRHGPLAIVFLPHDRRPPHSDVDALEHLGRKLPPAIERCDLLHSLIPRAADLKGIAGRCDAVLSGRMHLGIAALGSGTPTACLAYQGKYQGLFAHFDLGQFVIPYEEALEPGRIANCLDSLLKDRSKIGQQIAQRLPRVQSLSRLNVAHLG